MAEAEFTVIVILDNIPFRLVLRPSQQHPAPPGTWFWWRHWRLFVPREATKLGEKGVFDYERGSGQRRTGGIHSQLRGLSYHGNRNSPRSGWGRIHQETYR